MINRLLLLLLLQGTCISLSAQEKNKIYYGMESGFTVSFFDQQNAPYSTPSLVDEFEKSSRTSFELGMTADYIASGLISFSSGFIYTERGGGYRTKNPDFEYVNQFTGASEGDTYNYLKYRLAYFELPLTANINVFQFLRPDKEEVLNLFVGASGMLNVGSKLRFNVFDDSTDPIEEKWEADKLEAAETILFALNAGIEWRGEQLTLYTKYSSNLTAPYDVSVTGFESFGVNMTTISFGMGVWFYWFFYKSYHYSILKQNEFLLFYHSLVLLLFIYAVRFLWLRLFMGKHIIPQLYIAPRGLITMLLFFSIPAHLQSEDFRPGILWFLVIASSVIMTVALIKSSIKKQEESIQL